MSARPYAHNWCFTHYDFVSPPELWLGVSAVLYATWQVEECPSTGTYHFQGCFFLSQRITLSQAKELLPGAHLEVMRGHPVDAINYCQKVDSAVEGLGSYFELGDQNLVKYSGQRSDLESLQSALSSGEVTTDVQYSEEFFPLWVRYPNIVANYQALHASSSSRVIPNVFVVRGPPGVGKTTLCSWRAFLAGGEKEENVFHYSRSRGNGSEYWDGYRGQRVLTLNDRHASGGNESLPFGWRLC